MRAVFNYTFLRALFADDDGLVRQRQRSNFQQVLRVVRHQLKSRQSN